MGAKAHHGQAAERTHRAHLKLHAVRTGGWMAACMDAPATGNVSIRVTLQIAPGARATCLFFNRTGRSLLSEARIFVALCIRIFEIDNGAVLGVDTCKSHASRRSLLLAVHLCVVPMDALELRLEVGNCTEDNYIL